MIHDSWQPNALPVQVTLVHQQHVEEQTRMGGQTIPSGTVAGTVSVSAQISNNGSVIALRVTNFGIHPATLNVDIKPTSAASFSLEGATVRCWQLSAAKLTDANTPGQPEKIVPKDMGAVPLTPLAVEPFSFTTCTVWDAANWGIPRVH
jgi:alpha-L-arabinofuranosidase